MLFEHAMLQDYAHLFPVAGTESLEYRTFECILVLFMRNLFICTIIVKQTAVVHFITH